MADDASREDRVTGEQPVSRGDAARGVPSGDRNHSWYWLFLIPFVFTMLPWIYNTDSPELFGMPFFYWYQMAWVPVTVVITVFVYLKTKARA
jgi:hypothetical protein